MQTCEPAGSTLQQQQYVKQNSHNMSVTSSATVSRDREVQSPDPLPDKLLVVSLVKRDGTPLDASSISEEDIVELCVRRAHTHPLGVLRYSAADSVVFLNDAAAVDRTQRALLDVTEFGEETVAIRTMAPMEGQATAFHAMWHSNPVAGVGNHILRLIGHLMFGRQPRLPVDVTLGLAPRTITEPNITRFAQKLRDKNKWAHRKAEAFQAIEAERHKRNFDKKGKAAALEVGDTVLVRVTAFKGRHKMQDRWENSEYVVEKRPYPDLPVYVVCPRDGEGRS